jgi:hypothetical protein
MITLSTEPEWSPGAVEASIATRADPPTTNTPSQEPISPINTSG